MKKISTPIKIVIVLVQHPVLGYLLIPYTAEEGENGNLRIIEQAFHASEEVVNSLSDPEREAIKIASAYTEKKLMSVYSTQKTISQFLKKITEHQFKTIIRPFIEKKLLQMIELISDHNLLFFQNTTGNKTLYKHNRYRTSPVFTELNYHFKADDKEFQYSLECRRDGEPVSLQDQKPVLTLISNPATLIMGADLHRFHDIHASRIIPFTKKSRVSVDVSLLDKYLENVVLPIIQYHNFTSVGLPIEEVERKTEFILSVDENTVFNKPVLSLSFQYGDKEFSPGSAKSKAYAWLETKDDDLILKYFNRNTEAENRAAEQLRQMGLRLIDDYHFELSQKSACRDIIEWIIQNKVALNDNFRLANKEKKADYLLEEMQIEQGMTEGQDWFELHITVVIGDFRIPFIRFKKNIMEGNREYQLPDGRVALLPMEWFNKYADLFEYSENTDDEKICIRPQYIGIVEAGMNKKEKSDYQKKEEVDPPARLKATLRQYQKEGFNWMIHLYRHAMGGCLADDMGLGKTLQTLAQLQHIYEGQAREETEQEEQLGTDATIDESGQLSLFDLLNEEVQAGKPVSNKPASLIVMPTSLMHNWRREVKKFTTLTIYEYWGTSGSMRTDIKKQFDRYNLILTTYGIMRNNIETLSNYNFEYIVLDESQVIKNSESLTFRAAIQLHSNYRMILTGTPIENSLKDLWSQFRFIQPGLLGSEKEFTSRFINPIKQGNPRVENTLQKLIAPFILRRTKQEVAPELPSLTEEIIYCEMTDTQKEEYQKEKNSLRNILLQLDNKQKERGDINVLNGITRLRQLASHPQMIIPGFTGTSGKLQEVVSVFETLQSEGHKVLIFSSFVKHLEIIAEAFTQNGWKYALLTGSTVNREKEIQEFAASDDIQAFLISLKAGGVGLNLTQADYVFILDPWWNPAAEAQAIGRAHRIGQDKQVFAYRFITEDTIEEKIVKLQESKRKLSETFIVESNPLQSLTDDEWKSLLEG